MDQGVNHQEEGVISTSTIGATHSLMKSVYRDVIDAK
jgi:hypothetical protein